MLQAIESFNSMSKSNLIECFKKLLLLIITIVRCKQLIVLKNNEVAKFEIHNLLKIMIYLYYIMNVD